MTASPALRTVSNSLGPARFESDKLSFAEEGEALGSSPKAARSNAPVRPAPMAASARAMSGARNRTQTNAVSKPNPMKNTTARRKSLLVSAVQPSANSAVMSRTSRKAQTMASVHLAPGGEPVVQ